MQIEDVNIPLTEVVISIETFQQCSIVATIFREREGKIFKYCQLVDTITEGSNISWKIPTLLLEGAFSYYIYLEYGSDKKMIEQGDVASLKERSLTFSIPTAPRRLTF